MLIGLLLIGVMSVVVGLLSGLLGIGGNVIAIPAIVYIFIHVFKFSVNNSMHLAIGTCLVVMVFTAISATKAHYKHNNIDFNIYKRLAPLMIIGDVLGAFFASIIHGLILEKIFGIFLLLVSIHMMLKRQDVRAESVIRNIPGFILNPFAFIVGFKSGLLGIGGGTMLIPFLFYLRYPSRIVSGTTALCSLTMAVAGAITFLIMGQSHNLDIPHTIGFIYIPAVLVMIPLTFITARLGANISLHVSHVKLKKMFGVLLLGLGIKMLFF